MSQITPGCWIQTSRWGKAVCTEVKPHDHSLVTRTPSPGRVITACADDSCKDALWVEYRYRATRHHDQKEIWVANADLSTEVTFLKAPTRFTARILKLTGPYGEGLIRPPKPPPVVPAGPVSERISPEAVSDLGSEWYINSIQLRPDRSYYDPDLPKDVWQEWDDWEIATLTARLTEVGWTVAEYDKLMQEDSDKFMSSLGNPT
jgi:hypothetical protein